MKSIVLGTVFSLPPVAAGPSWTGIRLPCAELCIICMIVIACQKFTENEKKLDLTNYNYTHPSLDSTLPGKISSPILSRQYLICHRVSLHNPRLVGEPLNYPAFKKNPALMSVLTEKKYTIYYLLLISYKDFNLLNSVFKN